MNTETQYSTVTYRAAGTDSWWLFLNINRKGLFGDGPALIPMKALAGTDNEWVTKTFEMKSRVLTKHRLVVASLLIINRAQNSVQKLAVFFNDCSD